MNEKQFINKKINNSPKNYSNKSKAYSSSFCVTTNSTPKEKIINSTKSKEKTDTSYKYHRSNNSIYDDFNNSDNSPSRKYIKIFGKFINLIQSARKDINNKDILSDYDDLHEDIKQIYHNLKPETKAYKFTESIDEDNKMSFIKSSINGINEPTSLNIELIEGSSERRKSIYKKFFDICQESVKDIATIFNQPMNYTQNITTNMPINIDKSVTNNVTNSNNKSSSNRVLFNVNLNVQNIRNISPARKGHSNKSYRKQKSKKYFSDDSVDDSVDLSESQTFEGVSNRLPYKNYMVNKPKDDWMVYKIFTEGDLLDDSNEDSNKRKTFSKTRSKSQLNLKSTIMSNVLDNKHEALKGNIVPDSNIIITESEGESSCSEDNPSDEEKLSRKGIEMSLNNKRNLNQVEINSEKIESRKIENKRDSKCLIF